MKRIIEKKLSVKQAMKIFQKKSPHLVGIKFLKLNRIIVFTHYLIHEFHIA